MACRPFRVMVSPSTRVGSTAVKSDVTVSVTPPTASFRMAMPSIFREAYPSMGQSPSRSDTASTVFIQLTWVPSP